MSAFGTVANLPLAADTPPNCHYYYNHFETRPAIIDQTQSSRWTSPSKICDTIASIINVEVEELLRLNPSLSRDNCVMEPGFSYCAVETMTKTPASSLHEATSPEPPICSFSPKKGEYVCPEPPTCTFDPKKGEYVCPEKIYTRKPEPEETEGAELK